MSSFRRNIMMFTRPVESQGVPAPTISLSSGYILPSQSISISITGIAVSAEYSTDNTNWTTYSSPITLATDTTLYARATDGNGNYSSVVNESYTVLQEISYIQSSATQYIDTNLYATSNNIEIATKVYTSSMPTKEQDIVGNQDNSTGRFVVGFSSGKQIFVYSRSSAGTETNVTSATFSGAQTFTIGVNYDYTNSLKYLTVNGITTSASFTRAISNSNSTIKLFKSGSSTTTNYFSGRMYYFKLYQSSALVRDYVPVRVGQVGYMYDKVSRQLFGNSGTGNFTLGNDVIN